MSTIPDSSMVLRTKGLTKRFHTENVVEELDLHIGPGEIYGFLGPNGAGKTTTIFMILGLIRPTAGEIYLFGRPHTSDPLIIKQRIGVTAEEPATSLRMTGWEAVRLFADLNRTQHPEGRMEELFHHLELWEARHALLATYSRGMRQKLSLIRALVHRPRLLILDEPVSGLDPHGIMQVRGLVEQHKREGGSALISSHILSEIERSADRVGILHQGRLLVEDTIDGIRRRFDHETVIYLHLESPAPDLGNALHTLVGVTRVDAQGERLRVHVRSHLDLRPQIFNMVVQKGATLLEMGVERMSLEEAFVTITNQNVAQLAGAA